MSLSLKLLGEFAVRDGSGAALSLPTRKTRALLGYLAVHADRPQPRERLMALLWSERGERQARQSLNQALLSIRKLGGPDGETLLDSDGERVTLRGEALEIDVGRLRSLVKDDPAEAAALYDGPFLDGLSVPDPSFEDWLLSMRSELHALVCDALANAANSSENTQEAIDCAKRLVSLDPLREEGHRLLMRLLREIGDRVGALRQYQACAQALRRELRTEPDPATRALFDEIRRGTDLRDDYVSHQPVFDSSLPPSEKPSIAVLPFENLGGNPQALHLAEGLMEDLITALAKLHQLFVVPRQYTAVYKDQKANVEHVAGALRVRYLLTGSIRMAGNQMRCSVQFIDTVRGHQVWGERYDRPVDDVFAVSDEIIRQILIELQVRLTAGESARVVSRGTRNLEAWLLFVQGYSEGLKFTREGVARARELLEASHHADPDWARAVAAIGWTHLHHAENGWSASREESIRLGIALTEKAIAMDPAEPLGYMALGRLHVLLGDHETGLKLSEKAASLAPNDHLAVAGLAIRFIWLEEFDRALELFERARRICPLLPEQFLRRYGLTLHLVGEPKRAAQVLEDLAQSSPAFIYGHVQLAVAYADIGQLEHARNSIRTALKLNPGFTISKFLKTHHFTNRSRLDWLRELLVKAGLPE